GGLSDVLGARTGKRRRRAALSIRAGGRGRGLSAPTCAQGGWHRRPGHAGRAQYQPRVAARSIARQPRTLALVRPRHGEPAAAGGYRRRAVELLPQPDACLADARTGRSCGAGHAAAQVDDRTADPEPDLDGTADYFARRQTAGNPP